MQIAVLAGIVIEALLLLTMIEILSKNWANFKVARAQYISEQNTILKRITAITLNSLELFDEMPSCLLTAEELLDKAEVEFADCAYSPFWDAIEQAANQLGQFDCRVRSISQESKEHKELAAKYRGQAPKYPIALDSVRRIVIANTTADRMRAIVRKAQCNHDFATIYEQRMTNKILIAGFTSMSDALDNMTRRISSSIEELSTQLSSMTSSIGASVSSILSELETLNSNTANASHDLVTRHDSALVMLNNIQRRRDPRTGNRYQ